MKENFDPSDKPLSNIVASHTASAGNSIEHEQRIKDDYEQAVKRGGESYANGYVEGLDDMYKEMLNKVQNVKASVATDDASSNGAKSKNLLKNEELGKEQQPSK